MRCRACGDPRRDTSPISVTSYGDRMWKCIECDTIQRVSPAGRVRLLKIRSRHVAAA